jgi:2-haloacid dehalogenase
MRLKTDFGLDRADILHTAQSLFHDHALANQFGVASAWITRGQDRQGSGATLAPVIMPRYDFRFDDMAGMVSAHRRELL